MSDTEVIERAAAGARDDRGRRLVWVFVGIALVGMVLLAVAFFATRGHDAAQDDTIAELKAQASANADVAQQLFDQVKQLGADPVVEPPTPGDRGTDGADGRDGVDGKDGHDGLPGKDGADGTSPPCLDEAAQCRGTDGQDGVDGAAGADGQDGANGVDGTDGRDGAAGAPPAGWTWVDDDGADGRDGVDGKDGHDGLPGKDGADGTSPPCLTEAAQCHGADGQDGVDGAAGADGQDGTNGVDGQPGRDGVDGAPPAGWTWVDGDGRSQSCTRTGGPDTAPTYTCTTAEPPPETVPGLPITIGG